MRHATGRPAAQRDADANTPEGMHQTFHAVEQHRVPDFSSNPVADLSEVGRHARIRFELGANASIRTSDRFRVVEGRTATGSDLPFLRRRRRA